MFTQTDISFMAAKGIATEKVEQQIEYFKKGFPYLPIDRAAVVGDGILKLTPEQAAHYAARYDSSQAEALKFVPASGAATRMFKELFEFVQEGKSSAAVDKVMANIEKFAFYNDLKKLGVDTTDAKATISAIILEGLWYGKQPKGLLKFHKYEDGNRAALEEHLVEGAMYAASAGAPVKIHFTVSPEHQAGFEKRVADKLDFYKQKFGVDYQITYSVQKSGTDTIAVNPDNTPFRNEDGTLLFRPAGHGALLDNLNDLNAEVIFIKTVDNVVPDHLKKDTILYKKALAGIAIDLQSKIFAYIKQLIDGMADKAEIARFIEHNLGYKLSGSSDLLSVLNRPLRVCGMVKNEGEPGGGPFWVQGADGSQSLQIAESSQISPEQKPLMKSATHFNPVDLVCAVKDYKGQKFDLTQFTDPQTGFISEKSAAGRALKAQELPGLWNGAMANWNTVFVEVPITTFAPVKTIVDLLRVEHSSK